MSTRKSSRSGKIKPPEPPPPPPSIDIDTLMMIDEERVHIKLDDDDNPSFMAEQIE